MIAFFKTIIYIPLYNILAALLSVLPVADVGLAVILLTLAVKLVLYPVSRSASVMQVKMKEHQHELEDIKSKYKNKEDQALQTLEFYRKHKINPFTSFITVLVQIPIIYSLYYVFVRSGLPNIDLDLLYSFTPRPESISHNVLGLFDIGSKSVVLALLAALSSFYQMKMSGVASKKVEKGKEDISSMMASQMKYTFPIIVFFISWKTSMLLALYWLTNNLLSILQDWRVRHNFKSQSD